MAVYTHPGHAELATFLADYSLGPVLELTGIRDGIENSNFFLLTPRGRHVLTIFERMPTGELAWCLSLMDFLAARGIPCALPARARDGRIAGQLCGKPAAVFSRLEGESHNTPGVSGCAVVGALLAQMHLAGAGYAANRPDPRGRAWRVDAFSQLGPHLDPWLAALLEGELTCHHEDRLGPLPTGPIHADLFRDNVLFTGERLSGVIDFYYACQGPLVYDLAVATVDWCLLERPQLAVPEARALLGAYQALRPLAPGERAAWPAAWRAVGLRFCLSRLLDAQAPRDGVLTWQKDPAALLDVIRLGREHAGTLAGLLD